MGKFLDWIKSAPVEWKPLGEVLVRTRGTKITAAQMRELHKDNAPLKIFAGGKTFAYVDYDDVPQKDIHRVPSVIVKSRGIIEFEYYEKPFTHKSEMWSYHSEDTNVDIKFVYYFLKTKEYYLQSIGNRMQMPQISIPDTDNLLIPIPPMEVQEEIVRILDKFTELIAALNKELELRRKQYDYYLHHLLTFDPSEVTYKPLGELCSYIRGITYKKHDVADKDENSWKVLRANNITLENKQLNFDDVKKVSYNVKVRDDQKLYKGDILMCASSGSKEHVGKTTYIADDLDYTFGGFMSVIRTTSQDTLSKYIYYLLNSRLFSDYLDKSLNSSTINNIYASLINDFIIPIPPLEEQERIVGILDKFEQLTHSLTKGLPREIELRQKQYEYYRNLLLSFE